MKKLITIALLTLSTCSLMAQFPVTRDNFDATQWEESSTHAGRYKVTPHFSGEFLKINGDDIVEAYDKILQAEIVIFETKDEVVVRVKNIKDGSIYFSQHCTTYEKDNLLALVFAFKETPITLNVGASNGEWFMCWKICQ